MVQAADITPGTSVLTDMYHRQPAVTTCGGSPGIVQKQQMDDSEEAPNRGDFISQRSSRVAAASATPGPP